QVNFSTGW
uniref:Adipokinetic hormone G n=2 Tax=Orthoptera TaxID=6993 RepID=AKHG_GRYBI|nr:RecName: Full=Adipokinetic hormone G; Short=AKH-G [Gryllus bimaculatus]P67786.1 RecName: Full=Adipokinetic hormone; Short=AKH; AltName: Full=RO II [Romalea microptera]